MNIEGHFIPGTTEEPGVRALSSRTSKGGAVRAFVDLVGTQYVCIYSSTFE